MKSIAELSLIRFSFGILGLLLLAGETARAQLLPCAITGDDSVLVNTVNTYTDANPGADPSWNWQIVDDGGTGASIVGPFDGPDADILAGFQAGIIFLQLLRNDDDGLHQCFFRITVNPDTGCDITIESQTKTSVEFKITARGTDTILKIVVSTQDNSMVEVEPSPIPPGTTKGTVKARLSDPLLSDVIAVTVFMASQNSCVDSVALPGDPTAVDLLSFRSPGVTAGDGGIRLEWVTGNEVDNAGFNIYREGPGGTSLLTQVNESLILPSGDPAAGGSYSIEDHPGYGQFRYWLEDVEFDGTTTLHPIAVDVKRDPEVRIVLNAEGQPELRYETIPDWDYTVMFRNGNAGAESDWKALPGAPHNAGSLTDENAGENRIYRVMARRASP